MKKSIYILIISAWILIVGASYFYNRYITIESNKDIVLDISRSFFKVILQTRSWNAKHGGVYTVVTPQNQPNPYLKDPLRDLKLNDSITLTKINPAYMSRQIFEMSKSDLGVTFHITSLNPIRPLNKADDWETKALMNFEKKVKEVFDKISINNKNFYRYMAPLFVEKSCLKCHGFQGYQLNQVRGGISVNTNAETYDSALKKQLSFLNWLYLVIFIVGSSAIGAFIAFASSKYRIINELLQETSSAKTVIEEEAEKLNEANITKDKFFSIIAHDLRSPFAGFLSLTRMMKDDLGNMTINELKETVGKLTDSAGILFSFLNNLLDWSKDQMGVISFNKVDFDINKIIAQNILLNKTILNLKNIDLVFDDTEPVIVNADIEMINTVIRNLISNAVKFTPKGGIIRIKTYKEENKTFVSIEDNGIGMDDLILDGLFKLDKKITRKGTQGEPSTGLGLILCKEFIERHNGKIWGESQKDKGSIFTFMIP